MKHLGKILMLPSILLAASACSDDVPGIDNNNSSDEAQVYMTFKLDNVAATRSQTNEGDNAWGNSNDGVEIGDDNENTIKTVNVFLVPTDGSTALNATNVDFISSTDKQLVTASFNKSNVDTYKGKEVKVMVYCNMNNTEANNYSENLVQTGNSWGEGKAGDFQMSNADNTSYTTTLPGDFSTYNTPENPIYLGTVNVKRAAARMDIKQGGTYTEGVADNKYKIEGNNDLYIELDAFALMNMSNQWYAQHRVSADVAGTPTTLLGNETNNNFVIDTDWAAKADWTTGTLSGMSFPSTDANNWKWTKFTELTKDDNNESWNTGNTKGDYKVWRYLNENTIPTAKQLHALSTGVAFRGYIVCTAADGTNLKNAFTNKNDLFVYQNKLIGNWTMVQALSATDNAVKVAYDNSYEGDTFSEEKAKAAGFTIYKADAEGKYPVYYHYWNRHNDNGNPTVMGPMEFAVVRNNVYKLCVTKINLFGSPDPEDPDDPDTPDEQDKVYFTVSVKVMPWVVRINNIEL